MIFGDLINLNLTSDREIQLEAQLDRNKVKKVSYLVPDVSEYKERQYVETESDDEEAFNIEELHKKRKGPQPLMKMRKEK